MAGKNKFGAFEGVFTPSILTILGVIMYMRMGWVVGNAGLIGTIIIILIAHTIAITTGLSVSSVATDKKIGAGGIYYVLSRSMGIPIGGSIGIALYVGTAFSIALYLIGFAESFNGYFNLGMTINDFRLTGTISLVALTALALISTSAALKAQFFILAAIIISLVSIFFANDNYTPQVVNMFTTEGSVPIELVFAIFFPAVTGFTAGIAMSGDLKKPKKSIPTGTLFAIGTGLIVYIGLAFFIAYNVDAETLRTDYNILMKIAYSAPAVVAGIWGATLSSALGGILGGPRILQAMSLDKVTPKIFGKGKGENNEPVNALILVFLIAEAGILIGELDVIARVVSMFYLTAYGFINISYFLESWANPDFQPTFKIKRWIGFVGFIACFGVMFKLDMIAMFGAFAVVGGLYFWLQKKQIQLQSNDVWQSVWSNVVNKGLKKLEAKEQDNSNWNPNIILFTSESPNRSKLLKFSKTISGRTGVITDFQLITNSNSNSPLAKCNQSFKDNLLEDLGIFGKKLEVEDPFIGIENIASTYGFTGIEPNTIMMNWAHSSTDPEKYTKMTQKLIQLDYNLLYLDYDDRFNYGKFETMDIWWRGSDSKNAELMLNIARYISQSSEWAKVRIRILFVNHNNSDNTLIKTKISNLIEQLRIDAEIKIINNGVEQKPFYKIIELQSSKTDLILLGIPNIQPERQAAYILNTDHLFETVGTTLLVKASNNFNELDLNFVTKEKFAFPKNTILSPLETSPYLPVQKVVTSMDQFLQKSSLALADTCISSLSGDYIQFFKDGKKQFNENIDTLDEDHSFNRITRAVQLSFLHIIEASSRFEASNIPQISILLQHSLVPFAKERKVFFKKEKGKIKVNNNSIDWTKISDFTYQIKIIPNTMSLLYQFAARNFNLVVNFSSEIKDESNLFIERISKLKEDKAQSIFEFKSNINLLFDKFITESAVFASQTIGKLNALERDICNKIIQNIDKDDFYSNFVHTQKTLGKKSYLLQEERIENFAINWRKNQSLAHHQLQSDLNLSDTGLSVSMINEMIKTRVNRLTIKPQHKEINLFMESITHVNEHLGADDLATYSNKTLEKLIERIPHIDFNEILQSEENRIINISNNTPQIIRLLDANSYNNLQNYSGESLQDIDVQLTNIQRYIIRDSYLNPLQGSIQNLETVFKNNTEALYNSSNLIMHILQEKLTEENKTEYKKSLANEKRRMDSCLKALNSTEQAFNYDLSVHLHNLLTNLNIRTIIESIETYDKVTSSPEIKTRFQKWYANKKDVALKNYKTTHDFILQKKRDVDEIKFVKKNNHYLNPIERTSHFVDNLGFNKGVESSLSFYYKKLFTGSHLGQINPTYKQKMLATATRTIARIDDGLNGGILILGDALCGKSFTIETIANNLMKGEKYYLKPPVKQNFTENDVHQALRLAFNKKGKSTTILNSLDKKCILIFDNLEHWWLKSSKGNGAINHISDLIEKFGHNHYFILSCNIHSYDIIRKVSTLEKQFLASILIPPMSKRETKEVLMSRHKTAGAQILYKDQLLGNTKKMDSFFSDIWNKSSGNIGIALDFWLSSIHKDKDGSLYIKLSSSNFFPKIKDPNWKIILYLLVLHGRLNALQFQKLFGKDNWYQEGLKALEKTNLIHMTVNSTYSIHPTAKFFVENWLKDLKLLN